MRSVVILGKVAIPDTIKVPELQRVMYLLKNGVKNYPPCKTARDMLAGIYRNARDFGVYATLWMQPHIDDIGKITLGVVIRGDHYLYAGNNRWRVGDLTPGVVFALLNKKVHGAYPRNWENMTPLIFAACEPNVSTKKWRRFCAEVSGRIGST